MDHSHTITRERHDDNEALAQSRVTSGDEQLSLAIPLAPPLARNDVSVETPPANAKAVRRFAGFTYAQILAGALILAATIWGMWATSKIFALDNRRVVSVRLAQIVNDFVSAEARSGTAPEQLGPRTQAFMVALDGVLKKRAAGGEVVLVGEAVVASSVPDVTSDVVADLGKVIKLATPAAMPPALMPSLSRPTPALSAMPSSAPSLSLPPPRSSAPSAADATANPFGAVSAPTDSAVQQ